MATYSEKREELWQKLCDAEVGSEEWSILYDALENLDELERKQAESAAKIENDARKLTIEEAKVAGEAVAAYERNRTERKSIWAKIFTSVLGLGATAGIAVATVKDEQFRALTSKVDQKAKDCIKFIKF